MKFDFIGAGGILLSVGVTIMLAVPPPWWPKMPASLVQISVVVGFMLAAAGFGVIALGVWPGVPAPRGPIALTALGAFLVLTGGAWWYFVPFLGARTLAKSAPQAGVKEVSHGNEQLHPTQRTSTAPSIPAAPTHSLMAQGIAHHLDYSPGSKVGEIIWQEGYARIEIILLNYSSEPIREVDISIAPEYPIIKAHAHSDLADCRVIGSPIVVPTFIMRDKSGKETAQVPGQNSDNDTYILPVNRLYCAKMPAHSKITVDIATVSPQNNVMARELFDSTRHDSAFVELAGSYVEDGNEVTFGGLLRLSTDEVGNTIAPPVSLRSSPTPPQLPAGTSPQASP